MAVAAREGLRLETANCQSGWKGVYQSTGRDRAGQLCWRAQAIIDGQSVTLGTFANPNPNPNPSPNPKPYPYPNPNPYPHPNLHPTPNPTYDLTRYLRDRRRGRAVLRAAPAGPQAAEQGHAAALAHARRRVGPTAARLRRGRQTDRLMVTPLEERKTPCAWGVGRGGCSAAPLAHALLSEGGLIKNIGNFTGCGLIYL